MYYILSEKFCFLFILGPGCPDPEWFFPNPTGSGSATLISRVSRTQYSGVCRRRRAASGRRGAVPELGCAAPVVAGGRHHARPIRHQVGDPGAGRRHQTLRLHGTAAAATAAAAAASARFKTEHARRGIVVDTIPVIK
jgi:hypothetical protein